MSVGDTCAPNIENVRWEHKCPQRRTCMSQYQINVQTEQITPLTICHNHVAPGGLTPHTACYRFSLSGHTPFHAKIQGVSRFHNASSRVAIVESTHVLDFRSFFASSDHRIYGYRRILGASCVAAFTRQPLF